MRGSLQWVGEKWSGVINWKSLGTTGTVLKKHCSKKSASLCTFFLDHLIKIVKLKLFIKVLLTVPLLGTKHKHVFNQSWVLTQ